MTSASKSGAITIEMQYAQCVDSEKKWVRPVLDELKAAIARHLTFRGPLFDAFSASKGKSDKPDSERMIGYQLFVDALQNTSTPDERLKVFAQWCWACLDIPPEQTLGVPLVKRLTSAALESVSKVPFNDLFYANVVQIWLPYSKRLIEDGSAAKAAKVMPDKLQKHLLSLKYEQSAVELFASKLWQSPIEFACEWLAGQGRIDMIKGRKNPDTARTLRNAYTRIFGKSAPQLLRCEFCDQPPVGEFYSDENLSASHCKTHSSDQLPSTLSVGWFDSCGRRWWRRGETIYCQPAQASSQ
jgi:hypothetical protein